jgi:PadR family transcriptional regulator, regulatory protein PadR
MTDFIIKRLFQGFICLHVLHHAAGEPFYGTWMISELAAHGYRLSPGTLYPILHNMEKEGLIKHDERNVEGKIRKYYRITGKGRIQLGNAKRYLGELVREVGLGGQEDGDV